MIERQTFARAIDIMGRSMDRDLLFGLLALQNNFVDRDELGVCE